MEPWSKDLEKLFRLMTEVVSYKTYVQRVTSTSKKSIWKKNRRKNK